MRVTSVDIIRAVRGPILLIVLGLLFVGEYWGQYPFYKTWPVLLIVYGLLKLLEHLAPDGSRTPAGGSL
jgi:hypothetical protein